MRTAIDISSQQAVRNQIAEAQKIAQGGGSEQDVAEAKIELEVSAQWFNDVLCCTNELILQVLESLQASLK